MANVAGKILEWVGRTLWAPLWAIMWVPGWVLADVWLNIASLAKWKKVSPSDINVTNWEYQGSADYPQGAFPAQMVSSFAKTAVATSKVLQAPGQLLDKWTALIVKLLNALIWKREKVTTELSKFQDIMNKAQAGLQMKHKELNVLDKEKELLMQKMDIQAESKKLMEKKTVLKPLKEESLYVK